MIYLFYYHNNNKYEITGTDVLNIFLSDRARVSCVCSVLLILFSRGMVKNNTRCISIIKSVETIICSFNINNSFFRIAIIKHHSDFY